MYAEDKYAGENVGALSEEAIVLLRKLIMMLAPASITTAFGVRIDATGSSLMDAIGTITTITNSGVTNITSVNQLGGNGLIPAPASITVINTKPVDGGWNYSIGDIITLSGGVNGSVIVNGLYDKKISAIDVIPISGGTGFVAGELVTIVNPNGNGKDGQVMVMSVNNDTSVAEVSIVNGGYDYYIGDGIQLSSTGSGSGLKINILSTIEGVGPASSVGIFTAGSGYVVGNSTQVGNPAQLNAVFSLSPGEPFYTNPIASTNGFGLIIEIQGVDTGYGNNNFLQSDTARWLYSDMIQSKIN
jgi:hypothetical protein